MSTIKIIKNEQEYDKALAELEALIDADPDTDSPKSEKLEVLALLIEKYEQESFPSRLPDPIAAIRFRMEQMDLKPVDLEPYLGSMSRVSEILSGKRSLTPKMIRSLEVALNIPSKSLLESRVDSLDAMIETWPDKLMSIMRERNYFEDCAQDDPSSELRLFFKHSGVMIHAPVLLRQSEHRLSPITDKYAQIAWAARVLNKSAGLKCVKFERERVDSDLMRYIATLSSKEDGPLQTRQVLAENGIRLVIEPHLPKTRLDGAVLQTEEGHPVIGMTLRHDRLDNFWFTLMHELAHISLHYMGQEAQFFDEFGLKGMILNAREKEADDLASETLVPRKKWDNSPAKTAPSRAVAEQLAAELGVDISIIAGKIRFESGDWGYLNAVTKNKTVRQFFPHPVWGT